MVRTKAKVKTHDIDGEDHDICSVDLNDGKDEYDDCEDDDHDDGEDDRR